MITVDDLYNHFSVLNNAKDNVLQHKDSYISILSGLKSGSQEKRLASQFVARFFKFFPDHAEQGLESMFDLCEDADPSVRKQAIKDLPVICKVCPDHCQKVSNVLSQLLHRTDPLEMNLAQMSLMSLLKTDPKATLSGIFGQILDGEEAVRTKAIAFLGAKVKVLISEDILSKDGGEEFFIEQCKKVLMDVTGSEFTVFMKILSAIPSLTSLQGRLQLLEIITEQAELSKAFDAKDLDGIACLVQCIKQAIQLFSKNVHSHNYVEYICVKVLPNLDIIALPDIRFEIVRLLAEMVTFCGPLKSAEDCVRNVYEELLRFMPLPPADNGEPELAASAPKLQFSHVECLMYTFHQLARNTPLFLAAPENSDRLKDFRSRLQYFARRVQAYMKSLKTVTGTSNTENVTEEVRALALKTTGNINLLIKDLFHNPPSYKASITLSFKSPSEANIRLKRMSTEAVVGPDEQGKKAKSEQALYVPPARKNVGNYTSTARGRNGNFQGY